MNKRGGKTESVEGALGEPVSELPFKKNDAVRSDLYRLQQAMESADGKWVPMKFSSPQVATKRHAAIRGARWFRACGAESAARGDTIYIRIRNTERVIPDEDGGL